MARAYIAFWLTKTFKILTKCCKGEIQRFLILGIVNLNMEKEMRLLWKYNITYSKCLSSIPEIWAYNFLSNLTFWDGIMLQRCLILLQDHLTFRKVFKYSIFISHAITECSIPLTLTSAFYQHNVDLKNYYFKLLISQCVHYHMLYVINTYIENTQ